MVGPLITGGQLLKQEHLGHKPPQRGIAKEECFQVPTEYFNSFWTLLMKILRRWQPCVTSGYGKTLGQHPAHAVARPQDAK